MTKPTARIPAWVIGCAMLLAVASCSSTKEGVQRRNRAMAARPSTVDVNQDLGLAEMSADVRTVQLYGGEDERQLPILSLGGSDPLVLEFDLLGEAGRPLSVYFYHADRNWQRDLMPVEYMNSFDRDDLLDFTISHATDLHYVHYNYRFPNASIGFTVSGNYILRITEQGAEDDVLFEQPFFVTEQTAPAELQLNNVMLGGGYPSTVPLLRFTPPSSAGASPFDFSVCFVENGRFESARCSTQPLLTAQPDLQFDLDPNLAFPPSLAENYLDLSMVRVGSQIERADLSTNPPSVTLKPDYSNFPGTPFAPFLNGQTVVSGAVTTVADPDVSAEYVEVGFSIVPPNEQALTSDVYVVGSFSGWKADPRYRMTWIPDRGRYEGEVLLKQGLYEYRYASRDERFRQAQRLAPPRSDNVYTAFTYYRDMQLNTDRLIGVQGTSTQR
ncbi:MAG TPA: type IX secretion system plug protein domain-containing protein [Rhodothermales bacterium]|nr:type IX secretion system plug protein domain-containing protein [Rhodothermales bacterium]